jgi:hypothetical protein
MKEFSQYGKKVDSVVQEHMNIIIDEIRKKIKDVVSVMAIGGLGRGEGSFLIEDKITPLNDYDIYLITEIKVSFKELKEISAAATKRIMENSNFSFSKSSSLMEFYVDLRNLTLGELRKVEPMIKYYEIRESAKIIYGRDVRKDMPKFSLSEIPLEEGLRFIMNRMSLLIECFNPEKMEDLQTKKTIMYYISKNYLSCAESLLLLNGKFQSSYKKRAEIIEQCYKNEFPELYNLVPDLPKKITLFTQNKLKPSKKFFQRDVKKYWMSAREDMIKVSNFYIRKAFGVNSSSTIGLSRSLEKLDKTFIKNYLRVFSKSKFGIDFPDFLYTFLSPFGKFYFNYLYYRQNFLLNRKRNFRILFSLRDINLRIYSLCPLVLFSINPDLTINKNIFTEAVRSMSYLLEVKDLASWKELQKKYSDIFRIYQFLKS